MSNATQTDDYRRLLRAYHAAWAEGDLNALDETLHPDFVTYNLSNGEERGSQWEKENCATWHQAFSETEVTIQQMLLENNRVTVHWRLTATHTSEFMGIPAADTQISIAGMEINRIEDSLIHETWRLSDTMTLMQQLNALR